MMHPRSDPAERPDLPEGPRTVFSRFVMPADDWARDDAALGPRTVDALMVTLLAALAVAAAAAVAWYRGAAEAGAAVTVILVALGVAAALTAVAMRKVRRDLHAPLATLYAWALGMCTGDFSTRVPAGGEGAYRKLAFHINRLSEALEGLANEMDDVVWRQTERLREKNASLELMYEVAASLGRLGSLEEILRVSARSMMELAEARGALVRLRDAAGEMSVAVRLGECPEEVNLDAVEVREALGAAQAGRATGASDAADAVPDEPGIGIAPRGPDGASIVTVPLDHQGVNLGLIHLFAASSEPVESPERRRLLLSVGRHLGMSIAKARTDDESKMLSIVRERAAIAHELHDSLAQTLASLRLQADMLADSLGGSASGHAPPELARIQATLESANIELRELIAGFRAPVDGRDLRTALEEMAARYTVQSAMTVHLQIDGQLPELPAGPQLQVVRIVGEALANACAHSGGNLARVLVRSDPASMRVLVEDDGEGFTMSACTAAPGEHIGLSVMHERARWLGGTLVIESEPGEGTRVSLAFPRTAAGSGAEIHAH
ncbi:MAG: histidine kinase [Chromatiales bacterium]|nr:histidine kinase [Chromatiales bacterium]